VLTDGELHGYGIGAQQGAGRALDARSEPRPDRA